MKTRTVIPAAMLLLLVGVVWVIKRRSHNTIPLLSDPHVLSLEVKIKNLEIRPTGDHAQLLLTAVFDQGGRNPVRLEPPLVSLLTPQQIPASRFIGAMLPDPVLTGGETTEITLHYWLPLDQLKGPLFLEAAGRRYPLELPPVR